jgi:transposase
LSQGRFRHWPEQNGSIKREVLAHELQVLLAGGDPNAAQGAPQWRQITPVMAG